MKTTAPKRSRMPRTGIANTSKPTTLLPISSYPLSTTSTSRPLTTLPSTCSRLSKIRATRASPLASAWATPLRTGTATLLASSAPTQLLAALPLHLLPLASPLLPSLRTETAVATQASRVEDPSSATAAPRLVGVELRQTTAELAARTSSVCADPQTSGRPALLSHPLPLLRALPQPPLRSRVNPPLTAPAAAPQAPTAWAGLRESAAPSTAGVATLPTIAAPLATRFSVNVARLLPLLLLPLPLRSLPLPLRSVLRLRRPQLPHRLRHRRPVT
jgi:hypothetical protein